MQEEKDVIEGEFTNVKTYINKTDKEIKEIAKGIYRGEIFSSMQIREEDAHMVLNIFMPLAFMPPIDRKQLMINEIAHFYGEMKDAAPKSINGYPVLFSLNCLSKDDSTKVIEEYKKIVNILGN